jgi:hypothetical protein
MGIFFALVPVERWTGADLATTTIFHENDFYYLSRSFQRYAWGHPAMGVWKSRVAIAKSHDLTIARDVWYVDHKAADGVPSRVQQRSSFIIFSFAFLRRR